MGTPTIARRKPYLVEVKAGKTYLWCRCGLSKKQPFCDFSHKGTEFEPLKWKADESGEKLFCACKHTKQQPFCDGTHNQLSEVYEEAKEGDGTGARLVDYQAQESGALKAMLDNGCYVIRVPESSMQVQGNLRIYSVIGAADGATQLSQYVATVAEGASPVLQYPGSDAVLFIGSGRGTVNIGGHEFPVSAETGVCVKPGEAFQVNNTGAEPIVMNITVCPHCDTPEVLDEMPDTFDDSVPERVQGVDEGKREAMADRFFQVLIGDKTHGTPVTQFIGEIPQSRAAHHRHLYEETITILSGEGFMWTDDTKTPVQPGDTIFLPLKQHHSLECTSPGGMRLIGLFYPSMSPAINY
ncbi:MAG: cupin domain-containing protein [Woeseiaceae bacterium]|nr:cupin domain-containing protein [Woeseiaceae bacterium]